jgi:hypothetical protein
MEFGSHSRKRARSATEPTSSPGYKRVRVSPTKISKPTLRVNCAVAPQRPQPQPMQFPSPLPFTIDSSATFTSSIQSAHSSARFYHHEASSQMYDSHPNFNYQPQSYQPTPRRAPGALYWEGFSGFQPAWTPTRVPHGVFTDMCQTSVSGSVYSGFSNSTEHMGGNTGAAFTNQPTTWPHQMDDTRDTLIRALMSRVYEMRDTLAAYQESLNEILQMAALLGNHQDIR